MSMEYSLVQGKLHYCKGGFIVTVQGSGVRVQGLGFRVQGSSLRVQRYKNHHFYDYKCLNQFLSESLPIVVILTPF
jgi:hypothetical protein